MDEMNDRHTGGGDLEIDHEHRISVVEQRSKSNAKRIDEMEKRQDNLDDIVQSVAVLATEQKGIKKDVDEIKGDVKSLTMLPAKRWNDIVEKLIWAVLAAIVAFILGRVGL